MFRATIKQRRAAEIPALRRRSRTGGWIVERKATMEAAIGDARTTSDGKWKDSKRGIGG